MNKACLVFLKILTCIKNLIINYSWILRTLFVLSTKIYKEYFYITLLLF
jgi:hypothetical protein